MLCLKDINFVVFFSSSEKQHKSERKQMLGIIALLYEKVGFWPVILKKHFDEECTK